MAKTLTFRGRAVHGSTPFDGVNALNAAALAILGTHANRETFREEDRIRIHPIITKGGELLKRPAYAGVDVVMTAAVSNPADGYTQYADFRLTVEPETARIRPIRLIMTDAGGTEITGTPAPDDTVVFKADTAVEKAYADKAFRLYVAAYKDSRLVKTAVTEINVANGAENSTITTLLEGLRAGEADLIRAFLWEDGMQPVFRDVSREVVSG